MMDTAVKIPEGIDLEALEARCDELDQQLDADYEDQFDVLCGEYQIDAYQMADELGAKCIWALLGYVQAAYSPEDWD